MSQLTCSLSEQKHKSTKNVHPKTDENDSMCTSLYVDNNTRTVLKAIFIFYLHVGLISLSVFGVLFLQKVSWMARRAHEMLVRSKMSASTFQVHPVGIGNLWIDECQKLLHCVIYDTNLPEHFICMWYNL